MNEQDIILLLQQKNEDGLTALTLHYGPLMRYIIAPILPNPQDQEDCLAEVTLRVWDKIDQFDPKRGSWKAWLTAITRNTALNHVRALTRHTNHEEVSENLRAYARRNHPAARRAACPRKSAEPAFKPRSSIILQKILLPSVHRSDRR